MRIKIGDRVRVTEGAGGRSGHVGIVMDPRKIPKDDRGYPKEPGRCTSFDSRKEVGILEADGTFFCMFVNYLTVQPQVTLVAKDGKEHLVYIDTIGRASQVGHRLIITHELPSVIYVQDSRATETLRIFVRDFGFHSTKIFVEAVPMSLNDKVSIEAINEGTYL